MQIVTEDSERFCKIFQDYTVLKRRQCQLWCSVWPHRLWLTPDQKREYAHACKEFNSAPHLGMNLHALNPGYVAGRLLDMPARR